MSLALGAAIYVICWWLVLFVILPIGIRTQDEEGVVEPGTPGSAPGRPMLARRLVATTIISAVLFAFIYAVIVHRIISIDDIPFLPTFESMDSAR